MNQVANASTGPESGSAESRRFVIGVGRGCAGALIFGIPMLMTMELWSLGFYIERYRLLLLMLANIPLLIILAHRIGFERTFFWREACRDAAIAYGIGIVMSGIVLFLLGNITPDMPFAQIIGKIAIQSVPASIGAMLGRSQLGGHQDDDDEENGEEGGKEDDQDSDDAVPNEMSAIYSHELFLMAVGALFLSLNVAPTEEVILISYKMTSFHALAVLMLSIGVMHGFVYAVAFKGTHELTDETPWWHALLRFTLPGYIVATLISLYVLWTFGRLDDTGATQILTSVIVLNLPGAIGAAAARLIL